MAYPIRSFVLAGFIALSACDSAEERAAKHFESGMELIAAGDLQRAQVELRNVFTLDRNHQEARLAYARVSRQLGNTSEAYSHFLRAAEQDPSNMEARLALTEIAIITQNWDEAERHGAALLAADPPVEGSEVAILALTFRKAAQEEDQPRIRELTREAEVLAEAQPDNEILHRLLIQGYMTEGEIDKSIEVTEKALAIAPDNPLFHRAKAMLLAQKGDTARLESHLRDTIARFPDDEETKGMLLRLLTREGDVKSAQDFLRSEIETAEDKLAAHVNLIAFIERSTGPEAALEEVQSAIGQYENANVLKALQAGLLFDMQQPGEAISIMETVVETTPPGAEADRYKVTLARILVATGNEVGARTLVGEVLESDATNVEALKMNAAWLIEADEADEAISTLRQALDQAPEDAEAMTLMARAHERNGNAQLAQDLLALAVDASGNAPAESLRFARVLMEQDRLTAAEEVLINALRVSPGEVELLAPLGEIYLRTEDWPRAQQVVDTLKRNPDSAAQNRANQLRLQIISRVEGQDRGIAFLEEMAESGEDAAGAAKIALIRTRLGMNLPEEALALAAELVEEFPDNPRALQVLGNTQFAVGDFEAAEETLSNVATETGLGRDLLQYARVLGAQGKVDEARAAIDNGLANSPDDNDLLWAKASFLERENDIDGAIGIYETLYEQSSESPIIANNLASLLATYRSDEASLERAFTVARRLRGTEIPPFQDTYGWIQFRRGEFEDALTYLEPAAEALSGDPIVQYHLGRVYEELGQSEQAIAQYEATLAIVQGSDPREQIADAAARRDALAAAADQ